MNQNLIKGNYFRKFNLITLISVYVLILVGGIVRSTGSGMGCPDWPKCFGSWVPPKSVEQLPANYREAYVAERIEKNKRFADYLGFLGFGKLAREVRHDKSIHHSEPFNAQKTWTEYVNRLVGATVGILVFLTFLFSVPLFKIDPVLPSVSFVNLLTVGFQGWIGSIVVSTNLLSWMITIHMLLALVIVGLLIYTYFRFSRISGFSGLKNVPRGRINLVLFAVLLISLVQIVSGTNVREAVDVVSAQLNYNARATWVEQLGGWFKFHRSFAILIIAGHVLLFYLIVKNLGNQLQAGFWSFLLLVLVIFEALSGIILAYFGLPAWIQPIHLVLATVVFGIQLWLIFQLNASGTNIPVNYKV